METNNTNNEQAKSTQEQNEQKVAQKPEDTTWKTVTKNVGIGLVVTAALVGAGVLLKKYLGSAPEVDLPTE